MWKWPLGVRQHPGFDSHILHKQGDQQKLVAFFVCEELHFTHPPNPPSFEGDLLVATPNGVVFGFYWYM